MHITICPDSFLGLMTGLLCELIFHSEKTLTALDPTQDGDEVGAEGVAGPKS